MRHSPPKKSSAKKKTATKSARPQVADESGTDEFDSWAETQKKRSGCMTCADVAIRDTICALLRSMIRKRAYKISTQEIRRMIEKKHPDADIGQRGLERHLRTCERDLYFRARGRKNG